MKTGISRLSDLARHVVQPGGITSTGWPAVKRTCGEIAIEFDAWQDGAGRLIVAKRADGLYAADTVVISIPRQVGKTFLIGAIIFALCIIHPGLTVIWTAHRFKTARETFNSLKGLATRQIMSGHVDPDMIYSAAGNESINFRNGSRIIFGARERGGGRGFSEVDVLVLDESQILTANAMDDLVPTTNQAKNPLILLTGTPPRPIDPGETFTMLRNEALAGESDGVLYIEFSADDDADPLDREQWIRANPSYPARTSARAILRMKKNLTASSFLREGLGIWGASALERVMPNWVACGRETDTPPPPAAIGIGVSIDRAWSSIGVVSTGATPHLGAVKRARGVDWVVEEAKRIQDEYGIPVVIAGRGPAASLIQPLEDAGVDLVIAGIDDYQDACANLFDAVQAEAVEHGEYDELNTAVAVAGWTTGERRVWTRKSGDVSMLEGVTLAFWAAALDVNYDVLDSIY